MVVLIITTITRPVWVDLVIRIGLQEVAFVIMMGLHISDLFWSSFVVEPDAEAGADTRVTDAGVTALPADELAVMIVVFVPAETGVFVDDGVLVTVVFCTHFMYTFRLPTKCHQWMWKQNYVVT